MPAIPSPPGSASGSCSVTASAVGTAAGRAARPDVVLHVDHVVPVAAGGTTSEDNLLTACEECNLGKGVRAVL